MTTPEGETPKDRRRQWYAGIVTVVALLALVATSFLTFQVHNDQNALKTKDAQIVRLLNQHTATFNQQKKAAQQSAVFLKDLGIFAEYIVESNEAICAATHAACPPLPTLPKIPK